MSVMCANSGRHERGRPRTHASVEAVHACHFAEKTWPCNRLVEVESPERGPMSVECRGLSWFLPDGRGYICEYGHEVVTASPCNEPPSIDVSTLTKERKSDDER